MDHEKHIYLQEREKGKIEKGKVLYFILYQKCVNSKKKHWIRIKVCKLGNKNVVYS